MKFTLNDAEIKQALIDFAKNQGLSTKNKEVIVEITNDGLKRNKVYRAIISVNESAEKLSIVHKDEIKSEAIAELEEDEPAVRIDFG